MKLKSPSFAGDFDDLVPIEITQACIALSTDKIIIDSIYLLVANCEVLQVCWQLEIKLIYLSHVSGERGHIILDPACRI